MDNFPYCSSHSKTIVVLGSQERIEGKKWRYLILGYMQSISQLKCSHCHIKNWWTCQWCILQRFLKHGNNQETKIYKKTSSVNWTYLQSGIISSSISRVHRDHSICKAVMGCTAWALLIVSGLASDRPIYLTFPSSTSFLSSPTYIPMRCI